MKKENLFENLAATEQNKNYEELIRRNGDLYERENEVRTPFDRDYTRILHSTAYSRLKHKTQVFYNTGNDHICTRMEHAAHVESVSYTIARYLGLNTELTRAIATAHDIGHAPFGHEGEKLLSEITQAHLQEPFWHEKNGLHFADDIELLDDDNGDPRNLCLTYAVRDGIISHCGEVDANGLKPREDLCDLSCFSKAGMYPPATWEGCVVKFADKIAYVGRDIRDAEYLGFLDRSSAKELRGLNGHGVLNTTVIMNRMVADVCLKSDPDAGITLSEDYFRQINEIKKFNYAHIYNNPRFDSYKNYAELVINEIFNKFFSCFAGKDTLENLETMSCEQGEFYSEFLSFVIKYCDADGVFGDGLRDFVIPEFNKKIYGDLSDQKTYVRAIVDYISGMTDAYAIKTYNSLLEFGGR